MATTDDGGHVDWYMRRFRAQSDNSDSTFEKREQQLCSFAEWYGGDLTEVTPDDVEEFMLDLSERDYAPSTLAGYKYALQRFYRQMERKGRIEKDPVDEIYWEDWGILKGDTRKKEKSDKDERIHWLEPHQVNELAENVPSPTIRNELLIRLMAQTGMRAHEVTKVTFDRLDRESRTIEVVSDKTDDPRDVAYQPSLSFLMLQWIDEGFRDVYTSATDSEYLFVSREKPQMRRNTVNQVVRKAAENAGYQDTLYVDASGNERKKITSHTLRHTFAVNALRPDVGGGSMDLRYIQDKLGHEDISTTEIYLQFVDEDALDDMRKHGPSYVE